MKSARGISRPTVGAVVFGALIASFPRAETALYRERFIFTGDRGHVHASSVVETPKGQTPGTEMRLMIQRMLAERFKMRAHWEKREMPVYVLTMERPGVLGPGMR